MITVLLALAGLVSYGLGIYDMGAGALLSQLGVYQAAGWICAAAATIRYYASDDWDEAIPKAAMIVIDIAAGIDLAAKGFIILSGILSNPTDEGIRMLFLIFLPIAAVLFALFTQDPERDDDNLNTAWLSMLCVAAVMALIMIYMNPEYNPYMSGNFVSIILENFTGASSENPPTLLNIGEWSIRMKILGIVWILSLLLCAAWAARGRRGRFFLEIIRSICSSIAAAYVIILFFLLRNYILVPVFGRLYYLVEMLFVVFLAVVGCLLPVVLLFPNTVAAINRAQEISMRSGGSSSSVTTSDSYEKKHSLRSMPECIYDSGNRQWHRIWMDGDHVTYRCEDGSEVTIYNTSISGTTAVTDKGNFHWF